MNTRIRIAKFANADAAEVERSLEAVPRVRAARVVFGASLAVVDHEGAAEEEMIQAIREVGYVADISPQ